MGFRASRGWQRSAFQHANPPQSRCQRSYPQRTRIFSMSQAWPARPRRGERARPHPNRTRRACRLLSGMILAGVVNRVSPDPIQQRRAAETASGTRARYSGQRRAGGRRAAGAPGGSVPSPARRDHLRCDEWPGSLPASGRDACNSRMPHIGGANVRPQHHARRGPCLGFRRSDRDAARRVDLRPRDVAAAIAASKADLRASTRVNSGRARQTPVLSRAECTRGLGARATPRR